MKTFVITAGTFGVMAAYGYFTSRDLTKIGGLLFMALIGVIIASVVNMFLHSSGLDLDARTGFIVKIQAKDIKPWPFYCVRDIDYRYNFRENEHIKNHCRPGMQRHAQQLRHFR